MKYIGLILTVFVSTMMLSGCANLKATVVDMSNAMTTNNEVSQSKVSVQGRTIKLGEKVEDSFGPSFDFDKLQ